ncbi:MAG TPA: hypothetical protein VEM40_01005 [Nitrospirota bacterium]|nr:hypothetical protein [Nitrospirota bacterium]
MTKTVRRFPGTFKRLLDLEITAAPIVLSSNGSRERQGIHFCSSCRGGIATLSPSGSPRFSEESIRETNANGLLVP